jgi:hypothetical protein
MLLGYCGVLRTAPARRQRTFANMSPVWSAAELQELKTTEGRKGAH